MIPESDVETCVIFCPHVFQQNSFFFLKPDNNVQYITTCNYVTVITVHFVMLFSAGLIVDKHDQ